MDRQPGFGWGSCRIRLAELFQPRFPRPGKQLADGSSGVSGGYNLAFAATRFAAGTWPRGPETLDSCHNCMSHQELGLLWAIHPPETPEEPSRFTVVWACGMRR